MTILPEYADGLYSHEMSGIRISEQKLLRQVPAEAETEYWWSFGKRDIDTNSNKSYDGRLSLQSAWPDAWAHTFSSARDILAT